MSVKSAVGFCLLASKFISRFVLAFWQDTCQLFLRDCCKTIIETFPAMYPQSNFFLGIGVRAARVENWLSSL